MVHVKELRRSCALDFCNLAEVSNSGIKILEEILNIY